MLSAFAILREPRSITNAFVKTHLPATHVRRLVSIRSGERPLATEHVLSFSVLNGGTILSANPSSNTVHGRCSKNIFLHFFKPGSNEVFRIFFMRRAD